MHIMNRLELTIGPHCFSFCDKADAQRVAAAERSMTDGAKNARKTSLSNRKEQDDANLIADGPQYGAGMAE